MIKIVSLIAISTVLAVIVICHPALLSQNTILLNLVNHEILSLLAVIMTVTLASVANVNLTLNRIVAQRFKNNKTMKLAASEVKGELKDNCWYIFWGFFVASLLVFFRGSVSDTLSIAVINAIVVWIFFLYLFCMFDVYQVVFGISDMDDGASGAADAPDMSADGGDGH